jgi:hypothetical protein
MMHKHFFPIVVIAVWAFCASWALPAPLVTQHTYQTYYNVRFKYSISYPSDLLIPQGESANADGQKFLSRDGRAEMLVYGSHNVLDQSLQKVLAEETEKENRIVTYKVLKPAWFVISGTEKGRVFYQKTMLKQGILKTFYFEYDENAKAIYDEITTRLSRSFKG